MKTPLYCLYWLRNQSRILADLSRAALANPAALSPRKHFIFIVSHMRSFSSLLSHILGSHPDISGYAEMRLSYRNQFDLQRLCLLVSSSLNNSLEGHFVLDKLLHNKSKLSRGILRRKDVHIIFMVRRPEVTLKSIMAMKPGTTPKSALSYYVNRLNHIQNYAKQTPQFAFLKAESIIEDTDAVLRMLDDFLGLRVALSKDYSRFPYTGARRYGDPSEFLMMGHVLDEKHDYSNIEIPAGLLSEAAEVYESTLARLDVRGPAIAG